LDRSRHRSGRRGRHAEAIATALERYDAPENLVLPVQRKKRKPITVPETVNADLAAFLGYMVGDGHISRVKRNLGLTTGDETQAVEFALLANRLFGMFPE
jgi:stage V sporulation protein R